MVTEAGLLAMAKAYLGSADARDPLASPLYAKLSGLPPLLIQVGTAEILLDDATRVAERARAAGVEVIARALGRHGPRVPDVPVAGRVEPGDREDRRLRPRPHQHARGRRHG